MPSAWSDVGVWRGSLLNEVTVFEAFEIDDLTDRVLLIAYCAGCILFPPGACVIWPSLELGNPRPELTRSTADRSDIYCTERV